MITMNANNKKTSSPSNRRSSRRFTVTGSARIECRKGTLGLGQNLNINTLDISETGVRLVLKEVVAKGQEMEVLVEGGGIVRPIKRMARVIWAIPLEKRACCVGLRFDKALAYTDLQRVAKALR
jgi:hypothetical protein